MYSRRNFIKFSSLSLLNLLWNSYNHVNGFEVKRNHKSKKLISNFNNVVIIEMNDGQLYKLLRAEIKNKIYTINQISGKPFRRIFRCRPEFHNSKDFSY